MVLARREASLTPLYERIMERRPTMAEALDAYFDDLELTASPATVRTYRALLKPLAALQELDELTTAYCRQLVADRYRRQSSATALTLRGALGGLCAWLVAQAYLPTNPASGVPTPRHRPKPRQILTRAQLRAIWMACADDRMRMALLLLGQGLRRSEVCGVRWGDVRADGTLALVGKGGRLRRVSLQGMALFEANRGQPRAFVVDLEPDTLYRYVRELGRKAGVGHVTPHAFRHSFATHWMMETQDMNSLRSLGGWSDSSKMPMHYARLALEEAALRKSRDVGLDLFGVD